MEVRFRQRPSSARCYRGDSEDVTKLCHHCSRAICRNHASGSERTEKRSLVVADVALRSSREFAGLKDLPVQNDSMVTHCGDCLHSLRRYRVYLYFALLIALVAAVGLAISIWKEQDSTILMAAAVVTGVAAELISAWRPTFMSEITSSSGPRSAPCPVCTARGRGSVVRFASPRRQEGV